MHPVVRITCLLALALGLASAAPGALLFASLVIAVLMALSGVGAAIVFMAARRLRWILLSVLLLYGWLLPGELLIAGLADWSPSREGLLHGLCRAWMLLVMAVAARLLMELTPRNRLLAAVYAIARPLRHLGLDPARFCLRLVLTLEYALADRETAQYAAPALQRASFQQRAAGLARRMLREADARAESAVPGPVAMPRLGPVPVWQWLMPMSFLITLVLLSSW